MLEHLEQPTDVYRKEKVKHIIQRIVPNMLSGGTNVPIFPVVNYEVGTTNDELKDFLILRAIKKTLKKVDNYLDTEHRNELPMTPGESKSLAAVGGIGLGVVVLAAFYVLSRSSS